MANVSQFFQQMVSVDGRKRDVTASFNGASAGSVINPSKMARVTDAERTRLLTGSSSLPDAGTPFRGMLGFSQTTPNYPGQPAYSIPTTSASEPQTNVTTPVTRFVLNSPSSNISAAPGKHDLIFIKKSFARDLVSVNIKKKDLTQPAAPQFAPAKMHLSVHPVVANNPVSLVADVQGLLNKLAVKYPADYRALTVRQVLNGTPEYEWSGWTLDGAVLIEEREGQSSSVHEGFRYSSVGGGRYSEPTGAKSKTLTVATAGFTEVRDYWQGAGVMEGASLWLIYKKYAVTATPPATDDKLVLNVSAKLLHKNLDASVFSINLPEVNIAAPNQVVVNRRVRPLGVFPVSIPSGGAPDPSLLEYEDEWGDKHMGWAEYVGRVVFLPFNFKGAPAIHEFRDAAGVNTKLKPLTNMELIMNRENLRILMPAMRLGSLSGAL